MQYFKNDEIEKKIVNVGQKIFSAIQNDCLLFFNNAYDSWKLGEVLYDEKTTDFHISIKRDIFKKSFNQIFEKWRVVGNFESYITVFKKIFGDNSEITFERISPAHLKINIQTTNNNVSEFLVRKIEDEVVEDNLLITSDTADTIMFQDVLGIENFEEVQAILNSLNPAGIYLEVNFTIGE
jgi:hypothetical protein